MSLKRLSHIAAAMALAGMALSAHAAKDVVVAVQSNFTTTDPYDANDTLSQAVAKSFYQGLYGFDKDMKMVPVLATGHTVSKDGRVYPVKLRSGVKFHNGADLTATAVKSSIKRTKTIKRGTAFN